MRLNDSRASLDALVRELEGFPPDPVKNLTDRIEAARRAKAIRPFFLVVPLDSKQTTVAARETVEIPTDKTGFPLVIESILTDQQQSSALFNVARQGGRERHTWFTTAQRASFLAGDSGASANRVAPQDAFFPPEPTVLEKNESLSILISGDAATPTTTLTNTFLTLTGRRVFPSTSPEGQLDGIETGEISRQIQSGGRREWRLSRCHIDYSTTALATNIEFEQLNEWTHVLGFATTLRWSMVQIRDPRAHVWTNNNDGIPSAALASYPFYTDGTSFENYRFWPFSYLMPPHQSLILTCTKRAAAGGYTNNITEDNAGDFVMIHRTV